MKLKLYLLGFCLTVFPVVYMKAQVTVGSNQSPQPFAALQIDGQGERGLRIAKLAETDKAGFIPAGKEALAKGLLIYNTTLATLEFFNGTAWIPFGVGYNAQNGVSKTSDHKIQLGGDLTAATTVDQKAFSLAFPTTGTGAYTVNNDALKIDGTNVTLNNVDFLVTDAGGTNNTFKVDNSTKVITAEVGTDGLSVNSGVLKIAGDEVSVKGKLAYKDAAGTYSSVTGDDVVLHYDDATGIPKWKKLSPTIKVLNFDVDRGTSLKFTNNFSDGDLTKEYTIPEGKWLIVGKVTAYTRDATKDYCWDTWLRVLDVGAGQPLYVTTEQTEKKVTSGDENNGSYSVPQVAFICDAPAAGLRVKFQLRTPKGNTTLTARPGTYGAPYFKAIRLADK